MSAPAVRVAVVIPRFAPVFGGAENQCRLLNARLLEGGGVVIPFVLTRRIARGLPARAEVDGVPVRRLGGPGLSRWREYAFYAAAAVRLVVQRRRYDVIHCHTTNVVGFFMVVAGRVAGRPVLLKLSSSGELLSGFVPTGAGTSLPRRVLSRLRRRLAAFTAAHAHTVALNAEGLDELTRAGAARSSVLPNGVDARRFRPPTRDERAGGRATVGARPDDVLFLYTGRFAQPKGIDVLLPAFQLVRDRVGTTARLVLVGSGELQVDSAADLLAAERTGVHVHDPTEDVRAFLAGSDVFVFPSRREGLPNAVLEAIAAGLPCVLSDIGPHRELADANPSHPIVLFRSGDVDALAGAMRRAHEMVVASRGEHRPRVSHLSAAFDIDTVAAGYAAIYRRLHLS